MFQLGLSAVQELFSYSQRYNSGKCHIYFNNLQNYSIQHFSFVQPYDFPRILVLFFRECLSTTWNSRPMKPNCILNHFFYLCSWMFWVTFVTEALWRFLKSNGKRELAESLSPVAAQLLDCGCTSNAALEITISVHL